MAMARPMGRPANPPFALIGTVLLLAVAVAAAVALYLQQEKLNKEIADWKGRAEKAEKRATEIEGLNKTLRETMSPDAGLPVYSSGVKIIEDMNKVLSEIPKEMPKDRKLAPADLQGNNYGGTSNVLDAVTLIGKGLRTLHDSYIDKVEEVQNVNGQVIALNNKVTDLEKRVRAIGDEEAAKRAEVVASKAKMETEKDKEIGDLRNDVGGLKKQIDEIKMNQIAKDAEHEQEKLRLRNEIERLRKIIVTNNRVPEVVNTARWLPAKLPDGSVANVFPEMNIAYLRLTRPEQAKPGMRYIVHAKDKPIPDSGEGKATIEISSVEGNSIQAKIIKSTAGEPIVAGDPVLNLIVGPRKYSFVVFGHFDLNNDGMPESNGDDQIKSLITRWGGIVQPDVDITTNFLILGLQPQVPPKPAPGADPGQIKIWEEAQEKYNRWARLHDMALNQTLPIMNTNTFLHYIGFFNDDTKPGWQRRTRPGDEYLTGS